MDKLWAPWRIKYVSGIKKENKKSCLFCSSLKGAGKKYLVFETEHSFCILNIFPYNNGHLMVAPKKHLKELDRLSEAQALDLFKALSLAKKLLTGVLRPHGFNIGINISRVAGAGIPGHLHIHIVPRWNGDTNFMPVLTGTKIISQSLDELHKQLRHAYAKGHRGLRK